MPAGNFGNTSNPDILECLFQNSTGLFYARFVQGYMGKNTLYFNDGFTGARFSCTWNGTRYEGLNYSTAVSWSGNAGTWSSVFWE